MAYRMPAWYPPPDENGDIVVMQAPVIDRRQIDATAGSVDNILANALIDSYSATISHFISSGRRNYALGDLPIQMRSLELPGLGIRHQIHQRREIVTLTPKPQSAGLLVDLNLDGYIVVCYPGQGVDTGTTPVLSAYINACPVVPNVACSELETTFVVIMFGQTALRAQSLEDDVNPFKSGVEGPAQLIVRLVNRILPPRKDSELLEYFLFDWLDARNPFGPAAIIPGYTIPPIVIARGVQFANVDTAAKASPLYAKGKNFFRSTFTNWTQSEEGVAPGLFWFGEFFDRKALRGVNQSWKFAAQPGQTVIVDDSPMRFFYGNYGGVYGDSVGTHGVITPSSKTWDVVQFDLTPGSNAGATMALAQIGIDPAYDNAQDAYQAALAIWGAGFNALLTAAQGDIPACVTQEVIIDAYLGPLGSGFPDIEAMIVSAQNALSTYTTFQLEFLVGDVSAPNIAQISNDATTVQTQLNAISAAFVAHSTPPVPGDILSAAGALVTAAGVLAAACGTLLAYPPAPSPPSIPLVFPPDVPIDTYRHRDLTGIGGIDFVLGDWTGG